MPIPERFLKGERSQELASYVSRKYSTYGYPKGRPILYNPEWRPEKNNRVSNNRYRWVENASDGLRLVGKAHEIAREEGYRLDHTGWFVDSFQDETTCGIVYQLPARNGKPQYVPANTDPCNDDCSVVDFHSVTEDLRDAVRWSDSMAERYAEDAREYDAKDRAETRMEEIDTEIKEAYQTFRELRREIRANADKVSGLVLVQELVKTEWTRTKATIRKLRKEKERLQESFWNVVEN